jgi:hypothetical protein
MMEPRAFHFEFAEDRPQFECVITLEFSRSPANGTATLRSEKVGRLSLGDNLLETLENGRAFGQGKAECFRLKIVSLQGGDLPALLPTVVGNRDYLNFEFHCRHPSCSDNARS